MFEVVAHDPGRRGVGIDGDSHCCIPSDAPVAQELKDLLRMTGQGLDRRRLPDLPRSSSPTARAIPRRTQIRWRSEFHVGLLGNMLKTNFVRHRWDVGQFFRFKMA
jgi:hypothetical protein